MAENAPTILVADDTERSRQLMESLLAAEGYRLLMAEDGLDALSIAAAEIPDVILLDVMMPRLDGFETCRQLRQDENLREVPVLLLTALDDRKSRLEGLQAGADDFITKPIDIAELRIRLRTLTRINRFRALSEQRARFEQAIDHAPDGLVVTDPDGRIQVINPAARHLVNADAPLRGSIRTWLPEAAARRLFASLQGAPRRPARPVTTELVYGRRFPNEVEIAAARLPGDSLLFSLRDVTERKSMEQQLINMQRLEVLGQLAGGVVHDLNNMLGAISAAASLIESPSGSENAEMVNTIRTSAKRGTDMLQQLLSFSRGSDQDLEQVDLADVAREVAALAADTFPKSIQVEFTSPTSALAPLRHANAAQLHQIFMNLCVNARDAMPGGGSLALRVGSRTLAVDQIPAEPEDAAPGEYLTVAVSDTGPGIPPEVRARLFEPFFTTKPAGRGTGLGLATVARLVHLHGGFLTLDTQLGRGTTFTCHFPVGDDAGA